MREVLLQLQRDGLIQRFSRSGTIVSPVDIHVYKQNIEIRTVLEGLAGELAAKNITAGQLEGSRTDLKAGQRAGRTGESENLKELMQCEFDFHNLVYEATHNPKLIDILHELHGVSARFWHYQIFSKQELLDQYIDHREVLDALEKRDGQAGRRNPEKPYPKSFKKAGRQSAAMKRTHPEPQSTAADGLWERIEKYLQKMPPDILAVVSHGCVKFHKMTPGAYNLNFHVSVDNKDFIFRVNIEQQSGLSKQVEYEYRILKFLAHDAIAPDVYHIDDSRPTLNSIS